MTFVPTSRAPVVHGELCYVLLATGEVAFCDATDYDLVAKQEKWILSKGYPIFTDYSCGRPRTVQLHHLLNPAWGMTDHRNGNPLDNRRENLRPCTSSQNNANRRPKPGSSSRFKGVTWDKSRDKWMAAICSGGRTTYLGRFDNEEEAASAYDRAAILTHGEFARPNFPAVAA